MIGFTTLSNLATIRRYTSRRASSYDVEGKNADAWRLKPGECREILVTDRPGCIKHIWSTLGPEGPEYAYPRKIVIRMYWDGEETPSVEAPIGDFFGMGHGMLKDFVSAPLQMGPSGGRGMNCWFPMPFDSARITVTNECSVDLHLFFYIDYEEYDAPHGPEIARFHVQWRRENPTQGWLTTRLGPGHMEPWQTANLSDKDNYLILEASGEGHYVGCHLDIDCFQRQGNDWYGEGDDMIVIDGEPWPPRMHGTGTEDYFSMAYCPQTEYCAPYHGLILYSGNKDWPFKGKNSMYRYHIEDPVRFTKSIRVSIEHGHANKLSYDYSSTAYWYQVEPHGPFPKLLPVEERLPRPSEPGFPDNSVPIPPSI
ncbi:MAG: DUF2961 domain-containing protein [Fimbriimonadia bacterium]|jgi:hypothetical protein